jgi:hypothetical protein
MGLDEFPANTSRHSEMRWFSLRAVRSIAHDLMRVLSLASVLREQ